MADHLAMSDEDFLKQPVPEMGQASSDGASTTDTNTAATQEDKSGEPAETSADADNKQDAAAPADADASAPAADQPGDEAAGKEGEPAAPGSADAPADAAKPGAEAGKEGEAVKPAAPGSEAKPEGEAAKTETPNYQAFYDQVMKPFKANGRDIQLKSPEEAVQLMQMGANFTRKMQEIAPHRKILTMLDKNQLLSEDKLSFLIDLDKGDPEAIKKFIKDKGVDPLDIDTTTEPAYREGSHKVSDAEQAFTTVLDELSSTEEGRNTLLAVEKTWDQSSKDMLWSQPEVLPIIQAQRETGIYDRIVAEIDRQKTLGQLPADKPFLEAYQIAGDALDKQGAFADIRAKADGGASITTATTTDTQAGKPAPAPVATTVAKPQSDVGAADKAAAAAPSRTTPAQAKTAINVLAMSDEEFLKLGRLPS